MKVLSGRYELGRPLGAGGMGDVVEAFDRRLTRRVAVKLLRVGLADPSARARFVHEVVAAGGFAHPNVVTVYDAGDDDDRPYYVMELVDGRTLADRLAAEGALPIDEATRIIDAVLAALAAAHARGLVHRDVKPANVLLGADGTVKLTDFGIAKVVPDEQGGLTVPGQALGTPRYAAPEQTRGADVGPATDVYGAGVVLYEMLAGSAPFRGESPVATALAHADEPVPPLRDRRPEVPVALAAVVDRALEKSPDLRFADADAMRHAIRDAATGSATAVTTAPALVTTGVLPPPIQPRPPARIAPARRRLGPVFVAAAILAAVAVGGAVVARGGTDGGATEVARAAAEATTLPPTTAQPTTTTVPTPRTLGELFAVVAGSPDSYGSRSDELLSELAKVLRNADAKEAARLSARIGQWVATGQLDPEIGGLTQQLLGSVAVPAPQGHGHGQDDEGD